MPTGTTQSRGRRIETWLAFAFLVAVTVASFLASGKGWLYLIPPARESAFRDINEAKNWKNPILIVSSYDVRIVGGQAVPFEHLEAALSNLSLFSWPYGRVVAVSELGVGWGNDYKLKEENLTKVTGTLKRLHIAFVLWPPA